MIFFSQNFQACTLTVGPKHIKSRPVCILDL